MHAVLPETFTTIDPQECMERRLPKGALSLRIHCGLVAALHCFEPSLQRDETLCCASASQSSQFEIRAPLVPKL